MQQRDNVDIRRFFKDFNAPKHPKPAEEPLKQPRRRTTVDRHVSSPSRPVESSKTELLPPGPQFLGPSSQSSLTQYDSDSSEVIPFVRDTDPKSEPEGTLTPRRPSSHTSPGPFSTPLQIRSPKQEQVSRKSNRDGPGNKPTAPSQLNSLLNSSFQSLSSLPTTSQSSSRRVIKDGLPAVTNSDSDGEDTGDDDLLDPRSFFPNKRRKLTPPPAASTDEKQAVENGGRSSAVRRTSARTSKLHQQTKPENDINARTSQAEAPRPSYKYSMVRMVQEHERLKKSNARIAEAEAAIEQNDRLDATPTNEDKRPLDTKKVAHAFGEDSDERERMQLAMERTEALHQRTEFYFFTNHEPQPGDNSFPLESLEHKSEWYDLMEDEIAREQACLTGFTGDLAYYDPPSPEALEWMATRILYEPREELCDAYVGVIQIVTEQHGISGLEFLASLGSFYDIRIIGRGEDRSVNAADSQLSEASHIEKGRAKSLPMGLKHAIAIVFHCASNCSVDIKTNTIWDLLLLNIDLYVKQDPSVRLVVLEAIELLLAGLTEKELHKVIHRIGNYLYGRGDQIGQGLRLELIGELSASSPRLRSLKRHLALQCVSGDGHWVAKAEPLSSPAWFGTIHANISRNADFRITGRTDYRNLTLLVEVLDIAVEDGFPSASTFVVPPPSTTVSVDSDTISAEQPLTASRFTFKHDLDSKSSSKANPAEIAFNKSIDKLSEQLKQMSSLIRDFGTGHMQRTEAKSAIERLTSRLDYAVRTRQKPKQDAFAKMSGGGRDRSPGNGTLDRFFKREGIGGVQVINENNITGDEYGGTGICSTEEDEAEQGDEEDKKDSFLSSP